MSLPVILVFGLTSYRSLAGPNWPAVAYFSFSLLVAGTLLARPISRTRRALLGLALFSSLALSLFVTLHARFGLIPAHWVSQKMIEEDATNWFHGWRELGEALKRQADPVYVLAPSQQMAAEIIYYTQGLLPVTTAPDARPSQFNVWPQPPEIRGRDGLYVWSEAGALGPYQDYFTSIVREETLEIHRNGSLIRTYRIASGHEGRIGAMSSPAAPP